MRLLRLRSAVATACLVLCCTLASPAHARIDFTDIWWAFGGIESGWGANLAQNGDFIFVTFFIYGPNGAPVWYSANLTRTSGDTFVGPLYATSGTWFGAPVFPPLSAANVVAVGDATFIAATSFSGTLRYRIDTVTVTKTIERQSTTTLLLADTYLGGMSRTYSGTCPPGTPATFLNVAQLIVTQSASNAIELDFYGADSTNVQLFCVMQGAGVQHGKVMNVPGALYQCGTGLTTTAEIDSLRRLDDGIEMHWHASLGGTCVEQGRLSGIKQ